MQQVRIRSMQQLWAQKQRKKNLLTLRKPWKGSRDTLASTVNPWMGSGKGWILDPPLPVLQEHCMYLSYPGFALPTHQLLNHWFTPWLSTSTTPSTKRYSTMKFKYIFFYTNSLWAFYCFYWIIQKANCLCNSNACSLNDTSCDFFCFFLL